MCCRHVSRFMAKAREIHVRRETHHIKAPTKLKSEKSRDLSSKDHLARILMSTQVALRVVINSMKDTPCCSSINRRAVAYLIQAVALVVRYERETRMAVMNQLVLHVGHLVHGRNPIKCSATSCRSIPWNIFTSSCV